MDASRKTKKLLLSLVLLAQVSQPVQAGVMDWIKADPIRFGAISTSVILAGLLAKNYLPKSFIHKQTQKKLVHGIQTKLTPDTEKEVGRAKLKEAELNSHALRYNLFPAITDMRHHEAERFINYFTQEHQQAQLLYASADVAQLRDRIAKEHNNKPIALFGYIISKRLINSQASPDQQPQAIKNFLAEQLQHPEHLLFKNEVRPLDLLKTPLLPGEIVFIGYSDGDIQILLNENDRRSLNNLSDEQRDFIASLYIHRSKGEILYLNKQQVAIFLTLSQSHQQHLTHFYNIRIKQLDDLFPLAYESQRVLIDIGLITAGIGMLAMLVAAAVLEFKKAWKY